METQTNNQVAVIANSVEILKTGGDILIANQNRKDKALEVGRNILSVIQEKGMDTSTDERCNNYLANVTKATKEMKDSRASVTQIMDQLKKMYTEVENELDVKKDGTIPAQIQVHRNQYAKQLAEEAEQRRLEAERKAAKDKEAIDLKYQIESQLSNYFNDFMLEKKQRLQNGFNSLSLEIFKEKSEALRGYDPMYSKQHFDSFVPHCMPTYHTDNELFEISYAVKEGKYETFSANYKAELSLLKNELIDKLSSKLAELQEQKRLAEEAVAAEKKLAEAKSKAEKERAQAAATAAAEAAEKAAAEQRKREEEEADRLKKEAEDAKAKAEQDAAISKQGEETMVLFEKEAAIANAEPAPEARQGYEIIVQHPVGYTQIFALWFEKIGKDMPVDKIGGTKLEQMKAWAEKEAHKTGTKIESKFLKYEETFKAVNRKAK